MRIQVAVVYRLLFGISYIYSISYIFVGIFLNFFFLQFVDTEEG